MTCKDCKKKRKCVSGNKSFLYDPDGDSWANWCDDFESKHKSRTVHYKGFTAVQSGYNILYSDADQNAWYHMNCTKRLSRRELKKDIELYLQLSDPEKYDDEE